jgi:hypothetical protein
MTRPMAARFRRCSSARTGRRAAASKMFAGQESASTPAESVSSSFGSEPEVETALQLDLGFKNLFFQEVIHPVLASMLGQVTVPFPVEATEHSIKVQGIVLKVMLDNFGIERALVTTVHAYTATQALVDKPSKKRYEDGKAATVTVDSASFPISMRLLRLWRPPIYCGWNRKLTIL